eukprot:scaffold41846_cov272-Skeletonema_dohrnii-CCMP3373.AAC.1
MIAKFKISLVLFGISKTDGERLCRGGEAFFVKLGLSCTLILSAGFRDTGKGVGQDILGARNVMESRRVLFDIHSPTQDSLRVKICKGKIFMIRMDMEFSA